MDLKGQELAENLMTWTIFFFAFAGFAIGWMLQSFQLMMAIYVTGVGVAATISVPDWKYFNQNPLEWLPPLPDTMAADPDFDTEPEEEDERQLTKKDS